MRFADTIDTSGFSRAMVEFGRKKNLALADAADETVRRFVKNVVVLTPPMTGVKSRDGSGQSPSEAFAEHRRLLESMILVQGLKKQRHRAGNRAREHLAIKERKGYLRNALRWQGELAAGWNAAAQKVGARGIPAKVRRHGDKHGVIQKHVTNEVVLYDITYEYQKNAARGDFEYFIRRAMRQTERGLLKAVGALATRRFGKS